MAKKKVTPQPEVPGVENPPDQSHQEPSMEDPKQKLQNLKSLNSMLLKETFERRQQVETLVHAKEALEDELKRFSLKKAELTTELTRASDERACLEIERLLFCVFIEAQVGDMALGFDGLVKEKREREELVGLLKREVEGLEEEGERLASVSRERDLLKSDIDSLSKEADGLRVKVSELEKKDKKSEEEIGKLKIQYGSLVKQKKDAEREIEELRRVRDSAEKNLVERVKEIERLNWEVERVERKKGEAEVERNEQRMKIGELEKEARELNELVSSLRKEEGVLREKVSELQRSCSNAKEKEKALGMEIGALLEDKEEKERTIVRLMEEKKSSENLYNIVNMEKKDKQELIDKLLKEKEEILEAKANKESEIVELHKELVRLKDDVFALQESIYDQEGKSTSLVSEVRYYKDAFEQVQLERDNIQKDLDVEIMNLRSKLQEMEKGIEETAKELAKMLSENEKLNKEKKEMETQVVLLMRENDSVQKSLLEAQSEIGNLRSKTESVSVKSERALTMLKDTAASVCEPCNGKQQLAVTENKLDVETEPYAIELEAIKNAFNHKEAVVKEMKQQVEFLQNSVEDANRKNSFLTILSSATTVFAAIFFAYATRVR